MSAPDLYADPTPLRDDLQVRRVLELERNSFRISKDPRDDKLYVLIGNGKIVRVDLPNPEQRVGETIAQGRPNAAGELMWTLIRPDVDLPADVPIDAIREADASGTIRATNPTDEASYALSTLNGDIARLPRIVVASPEQYGIEFPRSLFIGADGTFYVTLDVEAANAPRLVPVASSADHGFTNVQGFDIAHDGAFYIGAITREGGRVNNIARGELDASGGRTWRTIARTEPIQPGTKNHPHPGITLSPDDRWVYLNSGSRTDHGEVAPGTDVPEGTREVPLSSSILRVPANPEAEIVIPASEAALRASGYKFADGFRNAFDMAFNARGELFAADNGPDSDLPDALMWVREGHHFGFPWRMGGIDNPQRFPDYDPAVDNYILFTRSGARNDGLFHNDPTYPPPPMAFSDPVINIGPDADRLRDPESGEAFDASDAGMTVKTFTPHSSPLGVTFDVDNAFGGPYTGDGFVLRTGGDCCNLINSFNDPDEDLLHLELERVGDNYQARVTRIVEGFRGPTDAEIVDNKMYVIERSGPRSLWEITFPVGRLTAVDEVEEGAALPEDDSLEQNYPNPFNPETTIAYRLKTGGAVRLTVFDLLGQKVATLVSGHAEAGSYSARWDGRDESGSAVASGVYLYRLVTPEFQEARRLALLR
jgi:glucose/arabinose dehydrogenase